LKRSAGGRHNPILVKEGGMEAARQIRRYTVREFLALDLDDPWHHELHDGIIVSMAPPGSVHQIVAGNISGRVFMALQANRPGCAMRPQAGIAPDGLDSDQWYEADLAVACTAPRPSEQGIVSDPILIIEVLSESTERKDRFKKLPRYKRLPSTQEILFLETEKIGAALYRRSSAPPWTEIRLGPEDVLHLDSIGLTLPVATLYAGLDWSSMAGSEESST
jgi:Uma2 family endonuclease